MRGKVLLVAVVALVMAVYAAEDQVAGKCVEAGGRCVGENHPCIERVSHLTCPQGLYCCKSSGKKLKGDDQEIPLKQRIDEDGTKGSTENADDEPMSRRGCPRKEECKLLNGHCTKFGCMDTEEVLANGCKNKRCECCVESCQPKSECSNGVCRRWRCNGNEVEVPGGCQGRMCKCCESNGNITNLLALDPRCACANANIRPALVAESDLGVILAKLTPLLLNTSDICQRVSVKANLDVDLKPSTRDIWDYLIKIGESVDVVMEAVKDLADIWSLTDTVQPCPIEDWKDINGELLNLTTVTIPPEELDIADFATGGLLHETITELIDAITRSQSLHKQMKYQLSICW